LSGSTRGSGSHGSVALSPTLPACWLAVGKPDRAYSFSSPIAHHKRRRARELPRCDVAPNTEAAILARVIESDPSAITPTPHDIRSRCNFLRQMKSALTNFQRRLGPVPWGRARGRSLIVTSTLVGFWQSCNPGRAGFSRIRMMMPASSESRTGPNRLEAGWQSMRVWSDPAICVALAVSDRPRFCREAWRPDR